MILDFDGTGTQGFLELEMPASSMCDDAARRSGRSRWFRKRGKCAPAGTSTYAGLQAALSQVNRACPSGGRQVMTMTYR